jgi:hypothetical protein
MGKLKLTGFANDSLYSSDNNKIKTIRLIGSEDDGSNYSFEIVSESEKGKHSIIDSLLGKEISIEVKVIE